MKAFKTSTGNIVKGKELKLALNAVANDWVELAHAIRIEDGYASHVTEQQKDSILQDSLVYAEDIRLGKVTNLTILQRLNTKLTGKCVALLGEIYD